MTYKESFQHQIPFITAKINICLQDKEHFGTGFYYNAPLNDGTDQTITLLISNKHVFKDTNATIRVTMKKTHQVDKNLNDSITMYSDGFKHVYTEHQDPEIDIACINATGMVKSDANLKYLYDHFLKPIDYQIVAPGTSVIFAGYPAGYYDKFNNLPVIRTGSIASVPNLDFNGKGHILIDAQVFPGSSGSPVFVSLGQEFRLLGIISDRIMTNTGAIVMPNPIVMPNLNIIQMQEPLGFGLVIKQRYIKELINQAVGEFIQRNKAKSI